VTNLQIPFIGDVPVNTLVLIGLAGLIGYILGSQIKSGMKIALILVLFAMIAGMISPETMQQMVALLVQLKPMLDNFTSKLGSSPEPPLLGFAVGFMVGLWKG
jgi:hypothetical protein